MSSRTMALLSYITLIGWIISYLEFKKSTTKSRFVNYHLGQGLGLIITSIILCFVSAVVSAIIPALGVALYLIMLLPLVLLLFGIVTASNEVEKPVPLIGKIFEGKFDFVS